ncbi:MAG: FdtA/QdtA family cupin domain-containing protein [Gemmatimonadetes bacterium]|nr:FdtA/QdtA family cupin domain-containing protein [Gemmatimonadota bacterium]MCC6772156.1 FdtA/QdtA family cupin domain-containing protein [Gemmatimonadaceae bacterium]
MNPPIAVNDCRVIALPYHDDARGSVTILERTTEIPFDVRRAFLITNVPTGATRGQHANMRASQLIVCASGALTVRIEDGTSARSIPMSSLAGAVLVPPTLWMELRDFAPGTVAVVMADTDYRAASRVHDRDEWLRAREMYRVA